MLNLKPSLYSVLALGAIVCTGGLAFGQDAAPVPNSVPAVAHRKGHHKGHRKGEMAKMAANLNLSKDQEGKIGALKKEDRENNKALKADTTLTPQQRKEKRKADHKATKEGIKEVLTPEQREKWAADRKEHRQHRKEKREQGAGGTAVTPPVN